MKLEDKHYQKASKTSLEINAALHKCQISRDTLNGAHTAADDDDLVQLVMVTVYAMICIPILYMRVVLSQPQGKAMPIQERLVLVVRHNMEDYAPNGVQSLSIRRKDVGSRCSLFHCRAKWLPKECPH